MAIITRKQSNLNDSSLVEENKQQKNLSKGPDSVELAEISTKTKGFFASTWEELTKVQWPNFPYILRWSVVIILFTTIFSLVLGGADLLFNSGIKFVDCNSPKSRDQSLQSCGDEFLKQITFR